MSLPSLDSVPALRRGFRFQFEPAQDCHVLLYPEGMVKLNDSAGEILAGRWPPRRGGHRRERCASVSPKSPA